MKKLTYVAMTLVASAAIAGCQAQASMTAGGGNTPPPPPPASTTAPPATTTAPPPATTTEAPKAAPLKGDVKNGRVNIPGHIVYDTGKATIKPESEPTLQQLKQFLTDNPQVSLLRIEGHTDSDGDAAMNLKLSGERALAVVNWLVSKGGIARDRLLAVGFGSTKPVAPNDTPANKEQNRRTEFHVAALEGKPFLGRPQDGGGTTYR